MSNQKRVASCDLVAGTVQVVEAIGQPVQRVGIDRRCLAWLEATKQHAGAVHAANAGLASDGRWRAAEEQRAGHAAGGVYLPETWLPVLQFRRFSSVAVDVSLDHRVPSGRQVVGQFVPRAAVMKRQAAWENHQILVVVFPQPVDDLGHQLQHAASALKAVDGRPVFVEPVEDLGVDRVCLHEAVVVAAFLGLGWEFRSFGNVGIGERAAHRVAGLSVAHWLEQPPPHDFECLLGGHWLPQRLDAAEGLFESSQRRHAALAACFDIGFWQATPARSRWGPASPPR